VPGGLFTKRAIEAAIRSAPLITDDQRSIAARWAEVVAHPNFTKENEKPHQGAFLADILGGVFGFRQLSNALPNGTFTMKAESASNQTAGSKTPDALLGLLSYAAEDIRGVVELKSPGTDLDQKQQRQPRITPIEQGFGYVSKFDGCHWVIVSDFITIRLYWAARGEAYFWSTNVAGFGDDASLRQAIALLHVTRLIGEPGTKSSPTLQLAEQSRGDEKAIADGFYKFYKSTRAHLFSALATTPAPPGVNAIAHERLALQYAQTILDRLLFICFAEDTGLLPRNVLTQVSAQAAASWAETSRWDQLKGLFAAINEGRTDRQITRYNGGLFGIVPWLDDTVAIADDDLAFIDEMAGYDFSSELGVEVLGRVFERSITDLEALHAEIDGKLPGAVSKRKKEGVFYTPDWVTRYVVEQSVGRWLDRKFDALREQHDASKIPERQHKKRTATKIAFWEAYQETLRGFKVLDPACGSGAFLVAAYDRLHMEYDRANRELAALRGGQGGLFDPDKEILEGNLYGVDINNESVEITRLSLWLKTARRGRPLNELANTIRCGDSLIAPPNDDSKARTAFEKLSTHEQTRALDWVKAFPEVFDSTVRQEGRIGFDVVIGNPPYVRGEWLPTRTKDALATAYVVANKKADLLLYFYERSINLLAPDGIHGFIVSNKWLKAGYGQTLRTWLPEHATIELLVDFGHSPIFEDADTFPIITIATKRQAGADDVVHVAAVPRTDLGTAGLAQLVDQHGFSKSHSRYSSARWSLETVEIDDLMQMMVSGQPTVREHVGEGCRYGIKTGYNDAFVIDDATRRELVEEDPSCEHLIRPVIRGREIGRWELHPTSRHLITLASSGDVVWPWTNALDHELTFKETYPSLHRHFTTDVKVDERRRAAMEKRTDQGVHWWELRSCEYYAELAQPKIVFTDIAWRPEVSVDNSGFQLLNTAYFLPGTDPWCVAVMNSPLIWWYAWRTFQHGKDEALRWYATDVEALPCPKPTSQQADLVAGLVAGVRAEQRKLGETIGDLRTWLHHQMGLDVVVDGSSSLDVLVAAAKKAHIDLSVQSLKHLREQHEAFARHANAHTSTIRASEVQLAAAVEAAFGLTDHQRALLRATLPPRTPVYAPSV
jgi:hypothetical protein